ncbi:MAG: hypothetical protein WCA35_21115 [Kovacikia sp.]
MTWLSGDRYQAIARNVPIFTNYSSEEIPQIDSSNISNVKIHGHT